MQLDRKLPRLLKQNSILRQFNRGLRKVYRVLTRKIFLKHHLGSALE